MKFGHIYVENKISELEETKAIIAAFRGAKVVYIDHYKDVFNRTRQNQRLQHENQNLILASKEGTLVYKGAPVCQSFGQENFYYTSCVMNCLYDCEYCYLKGMYPSGNMVIFVNLQDTMRQVESLLQEKDIYLCVSYDTDLLSLESQLHYISRWVEFTRTHPGLTIEVRTKCARTIGIEEPCDRVIMAYTISPSEVISGFEHGTGSLTARLQAVRRAIDSGWRVRLCFDPMIYIPNWKEAYKRMFDEVREYVDLSKVKDISVGSFRISDSYLKALRRAEPHSAAVQYPFELEKGYYHYPAELTENMEKYLMGLIYESCPQMEVFRWES